MLLGGGVANCLIPYFFPSDWNLEEEQRDEPMDGVGVSVPQPHPSPEAPCLSPKPPVAMETDKEEENVLQSASSSPHSLNVSVTSDPGNVMTELALPLRFLCEAHAQLGRMGWCCRDSGAFLLESVSVLRRELRLLTRLPPKQREVSGRGCGLLPPNAFPLFPLSLLGSVAGAGAVLLLSLWPSQ